ncbi:unnamed protein product [Ectocarpus sp. 4 AP-2014]|uniref:EsV-1-39 n=1 Tax=Ectocarpus siliculosus virus 1 (isolate New Zealand/Kaikoura/1988) TaxID=654926 RepID=Q8QNM5_ESV1K|nr:EsV-1-39 [Ectocarpus siliculosus virus 1]AAK14465.1 EsV-1-39 [Ectocarpus siliculosus virus 1]
MQSRFRCPYRAQRWHQSFFRDDLRGSIVQNMLSSLLQGTDVCFFTAIGQMFRYPKITFRRRSSCCSCLLWGGEGWGGGSEKWRGVATMGVVSRECGTTTCNFPILLYFPKSSKNCITVNMSTSISTLPNWSGVAMCFLDMFNPVEVLLKDLTSHQLSIYNMVTNTVTDIGDPLPGLLFVKKNYVTNEFYSCSHMGNGLHVFNLGKDLANIYGGMTFTQSQSEEYRVFSSSSYIKGLDVSLDGTTIYYSNASNEIRSVGTDGSNDQLILETTGVPGKVSLDPLNSATLVYVDGSDIKYHNLASGVTKDVADDHHCIEMTVLNGTLYATFYFKPGLAYIRMNLDGSDVYSVTDRITLRSQLVDTVNKVVYSVKADGEAYITADPNIADLPDAPGLVSVVPRPMSIDLTWPAVSGATAYGVKYSVGEMDAEAKTTSAASTTALRHSVRNLLSQTLYSVYTYYSMDDTDPSVPMSSGQYLTLPNVASNHDVSSYADERGGFDLRGLSTESLSALDDVLNDIFSTGDSVTLSLRGKGETKTKFVKRGDTAAIDDGVSIAMPFSASAGPGQSVTLALTDATTVAVAYDDTTEAVLIGGTTYAAGDSLVLDGQKVTIFSV